MQNQDQKQKDLQDNIQNKDLKKLQEKYKYDIQVMRIKMLIQEDKHDQEIEMFKIKHNNEIKELCKTFKINID
jgi:hypothetical protein